MKNTTEFAALLEAEKDQLEEELGNRGNKAPKTGDWQGSSETIETGTADQNEVADKLEDLSNNVALVEELEVRYREVLAALERIKAGTYGVCRACGEEIPEDRLEANPAAETCIEHARG